MTWEHKCRLYRVGGFIKDAHFDVYMHPACEAIPGLSGNFSFPVFSNKVFACTLARLILARLRHETRIISLSAPDDQ
jgi:hypothetical protein